ncbi:hypothetical protein ACINK0_07065 [Deinococcus sp. VB343]|uniref:NB-ARC domain-containing protein n=1 Tax=Deinococcus sp. VB142 TaxID=3112952 RepID=A0AAU6Q6L3_9DEIO
MYLKTFGGAALEGAFLHRPKPLLLLGYLAVEGARSRQHLRELFWPMAADPAASLRVALKQIREAAPQALHEQNDILTLLLPSDVVELITAFRGSPEEVLRLYRGEFFSGLKLDGSDEESELGAWVVSTREHFAGQVRSSLLRFAEQQYLQGNQARAAGLVRQVRYLPGAKPLDAADLGRLYNLALEAGSELSGLLREEAQEFGVSLVKVAAGEESFSARDALPRSTTSFIGRQAELRELTELLNTPGVRLITIQGVGGIGKTRLCLELAQVQGTTSLAFVPLSNLASAEHLSLSIAQAMRLNLASGIPPMTLITSAIADDAFTLYLDNFEHLLPETQVLEDLLATCPNLRIVVTSRQRTALSIETLFPLTGLDQSDGEHSDAARLFLSRARQANARFRVNSGTRETVIEICQLLDGTPLAIELAAGWVRRMPVQQIAAELSQGLELLEAGDGLGKRKSLRAIFEQSWEKLGVDERRFLMALSLFRGGFTRTAATAVTGVTLRPLLALLDAAFLNVSKDGRYTQHPILAHFVQEKAQQFLEMQQELLVDFARYFSSVRKLVQPSPNTTESNNFGGARGAVQNTTTLKWPSKEQVTLTS